jgi:aspartyl-tRNA(Asn)/glutamyl-tRNA(Gln) amidotransferase subunit A
MRMRTRVQADLDAAFSTADLLVMPATPTAAPALAPTPHPLFSMGHAMWLERVAKNFLVFNVTGAPAAVIPSGFTLDGRPTAIQIAAPPQQDERILAAAIAFQDRTDHHTVLPPL